MDIKYRHEVKHYLNVSDLIAIRQRLLAVMEPDPHAVDGKYLIRSLYFDNMEDKALREKLDGVNLREKFRIRYYNKDTSFIHLEKKSKHNSLGPKLPTGKNIPILTLSFCNAATMRQNRMPSIISVRTRSGAAPKARRQDRGSWSSALRSV